MHSLIMDNTIKHFAGFTIIPERVGITAGHRFVNPTSGHNFHTSEVGTMPTKSFEVRTYYAWIDSQRGA